ncbi:MAG: LysR family transcriptional regulator [Alphaproteobacteria bacterium]|nr:LysR family transcriptional regulator [Alphaproteobacteria bacterium]MBU0876526.1 LysR family transcriptional regulator [Alphaproteobacteria bacterium]MBU1770997.1 LysR family transcriptional regulator [Alphaproteobacteria bacterium]
MDLTTLRTFLAAAETGSFAGAARRVNASPSSVTERIKQLEHHVGARLFDRDKRGCRLTSAGRKFLAPATQAVRAIDIARHEVALPDRFTQSISFGAQYALWDDRLLEWLAQARVDHPETAWRVASGASARLNRDLAEGFLDIAALYDPVFRRDFGSEILFDDELILVTGGDPDRWRESYVRIEWRQEAGAEIASRLDITPQSGLILDLGARSADWLKSHAMAGFMPRRSVAKSLLDGSLKIVANAPAFPFPAYICWNRSLEPALLAQIVMSLKGAKLDRYPGKAGL